MSSFLKTNYNPDVLSCLANLSNDEVFTPPEVVNQMLDRLPESLWRDKNARFLDPVCKSGVFLREIAKRLIVGLEHDFPDLQTRLNHIFTQQLYGIAITELTGHIAPNMPTASYPFVPLLAKKKRKAIFAIGALRIVGKRASAANVVRAKRCTTAIAMKWKTMPMPLFTAIGRKRFWK